MIWLLGQCHGKSSFFVLISGCNLLEDELDSKMGRGAKNTLLSFFRVIRGETFCKKMLSFHVLKYLNY